MKTIDRISGILTTQDGRFGGEVHFALDLCK